MSPLNTPVSNLLRQTAKAQSPLFVVRDAGQLKEEPVRPGQAVQLVGVLVEERPLLGGGGELEHLLHHVGGELLPGVHAQDGSGREEGMACSMVFCNVMQYVIDTIFFAVKKLRS